jgi:dipeptidyl aminopeptidase/acylaminoacyl peptidase
MTRRRGLLAGLVSAVAAYVGYLGVIGSRRVVVPILHALDEPAELPRSPAELGLPHEEVRFTTDDGVTLDGWLIPAARETRSAVILLHGFSWHRVPWLSLFVPWLQRRYHVLQFDFRGHGASDAAAITLGTAERQDVAAAVRFLAGRGLGPIALYGISMGAATAILAAPELPVAAVVADAAYADLRHPIANRMREMRLPFADISSRIVVVGAAVRARTRLLSPIDRVADVAPRGLLLIAPRQDRLVDWRQSVRLYESAGEPKELYVVDGAGHGEARTVGGEQYERRVLAFLEHHLDPERAPELAMAEAGGRL